MKSFLALTALVQIATAFSGDGTFYWQNGVTGYCGELNPDTALIAAIKGVKGNCFNCALINGPKGQVRVRVVDECEGCKPGADIDMSVTAFDQVASRVDGRVPVTWDWVPCDGSAPAAITTTQQTTTSTTVSAATIINEAPAGTGGSTAGNVDTTTNTSGSPGGSITESTGGLVSAGGAGNSTNSTDSTGSGPGTDSSSTNAGSGSTSAGGSTSFTDTTNSTTTNSSTNAVNTTNPTNSTTKTNTTMIKPKNETAVDAGTNGSSMLAVGGYVSIVAVISALVTL